LFKVDTKVDNLPNQSGKSEIALISSAFMSAFISILMAAGSLDASDDMAMVVAVFKQKK